nr:PREDICTED: gallinacin-8-like isoform X1 [Struthio camelus australis]
MSRDFLILPIPSSYCLATPTSWPALCILQSKLLYFVTLNLDMKISYFFFAVLLLVLQSTLGFMRAPDNDVQCKQAGGSCSMDRCPLRTRAFGRCQKGIPCCRTVYD